MSHTKKFYQLRHAGPQWYVAGFKARDKPCHLDDSDPSVGYPRSSPSAGPRSISAPSFVC